MSVTQKSLNEVLSALNSGELSMEELVNQLSTETQYVRRGATFARLVYDGVSFMYGKPARVFTIEGGRIDRNGVKVERKPRASKNGSTSD